MHHIGQAATYLLDQSGSHDPYELAKFLGISVEEFPFKKIKGMIIKLDGQVNIFLNSNLPDWYKRFILAHELGHQQLSPQGAGYFFISECTLMESKIEYEANRFAVELLAGDQEPEIDETVEQFAARVGVPVEMMRYRVIR